MRIAGRKHQISELVTTWQCSTVDNIGVLVVVVVIVGVLVGVDVDIDGGAAADCVVEIVGIRLDLGEETKDNEEGDDVKDEAD